MENSAAAPGLEEDVSRYVQEIREFPRLTEQEEYRLAMQCARGDEQAIRTMVNSNLRLVVSVARQYAGRGVPLLDLIQEGSIGLLAAAKKFDYTRNIRFSTYATKWIRQGITRCILNHAGLIRVPAYTMEQVRQLMAAKARLQQQGEEESARQIALLTGIPEEKVQKLLTLLPQISSLDALVGDESSLSDLLEDVQAPEPEKQLVRRELRNTLDTLLGMLTPRQSRVLRLHFGLEDGISHSLSEVGALLGISKQRAQQIQREAMDKLQRLGSSMGLEDFLDDADEVF